MNILTTILALALSLIGALDENAHCATERIREIREATVTRSGVLREMDMHLDALGENALNPTRIAPILLEKMYPSEASLEELLSANPERVLGANVLNGILVAGYIPKPETDEERASATPHPYELARNYVLGHNGKPRLNSPGFQRMDAHYQRRIGLRKYLRNYMDPVHLASTAFWTPESTEDCLKYLFGESVSASSNPSFTLVPADRSWAIERARKWLEDFDNKQQRIKDAYFRLAAPGVPKIFASLSNPIVDYNVTVNRVGPEVKFQAVTTQAYVAIFDQLVPKTADLFAMVSAAKRYGMDLLVYYDPSNAGSKNRILHMLQFARRQRVEIVTSPFEPLVINSAGHVRL